MSKTATVLGATGLIGGQLVSLLLDDPHFSKVRVVGRRSTGISHKKLSEKLGDLFDERFLKKAITGDVVFCCIGTTQAKTPDLKIYRKIDFGIPVNSIAAAKKNGAEQFLVVSSMGANAKSRVFYNRTKGHMEEALLKSNLKKVNIFRPSMLLGDRSETRVMESIGKLLFRVAHNFLPKRYRGIESETVAMAMIEVAKTKPDQQIFQSDEIQNWA